MGRPIPGSLYVQNRCEGAQERFAGCMNKQSLECEESKKTGLPGRPTHAKAANILFNTYYVPGIVQELGNSSEERPKSLP